MKKKIKINTLDELSNFCQKLVAHLNNDFNLYLHGDLGAGKTTFCQHLLRAFGYHLTVKSPTYTLVKSYKIEQQTIFHFDFYRLDDSAELEFLGIDDYFNQAAIRLIEWPEKVKDLLPKPDIDCYIECNDEKRIFSFSANTEQGLQALKHL